MPHTPAPDDMTARHAALLQELAEIGMALARRVRDEVEDGSVDGAEAALRYARIARAVRQTLALEARLAEPLAARRERCGRADDGAGRKLEAAMVVERAIDREAVGDQAERLHEALYERLIDGLDDEDFGEGRPLAEVIAGICRDLGLSPDWRAFTDDDWGLARPHTRVALMRGAGLDEADDPPPRRPGPS